MINTILSNLGFFLSVLSCAIGQGFFKMISDGIMSGYFETFFSVANTEGFWGKKSYVRKWKNGNKIEGERFFLSSTLLVWTTDAWHLSNALGMICNVLSLFIILKFSFGFFVSSFSSLLFWVFRSVTFHVFFTKLSNSTMKNIFIFFFSLISFSLSAQSAGGAGECKIGVDPNTVALFNVIDQKTECTTIIDTVTTNEWRYNVNLAVGARWENQHNFNSTNLERRRVDDSIAVVTLGLNLDKVLAQGNTSLTREMTVSRVSARGNPDSHPSNFLFGSGMDAVVTGTNNTASGRANLSSLTTGYNNHAYGVAGLYEITAAHDNIAFGHLAIRYKKMGDFNIGIGTNALFRDIDGSYNLAIGGQSLFNVQGSSNTAIGFQAGYLLLSGENNITIGASANVHNANANNQLSIGNWIYGADGKISIGGTTPPINKFEIAGTDAIRVPNGTTAERPSSTQFGQVRYNTTLGRGEMYVNDANGDGTLGDAGWRTF